MNASGQLRPPAEPWIDTAPADTTTDGGGWLDTATRALESVPNLAWVLLFALLLIVTLVVLPIARRLAYKAGARTAGKTSASDRKDRALFIAAVAPAFAVLAAVLAGNQRGLVAFGRDDLHWHDGWEYLVPVTLDGVGLAFGFLAFRAVRKRRSPDRAVRIAWGAAVASAVINFGHESGLPGGSSLAGGYLALLSMFVMVIFHELLDQFTEGTEWIKREFPAFKLRWITWPSNTACAWVAWRNYPPAEGSNATVAEAIRHLDEVRELKRQRRRARDLEDVCLPAPWWSLLAPWVRVRQLTAALAVAHMSAATTGHRADTRPDMTPVMPADTTTDIGPHMTTDIRSGHVTATAAHTMTGQPADTAGDTMTVTATATPADTATGIKAAPRRSRNRTSARSPKWTPAQLKAFKMRDEDDTVTYSQIARKVNASEKTVSRWFKARDAAEEALRASVVRPDILSGLPQPSAPVTSGVNGHSIDEGGLNAEIRPVAG